MLVVAAHPDADSFNHGVARAVVEAAGRAGGASVVHDLYRDGFDPRLTAAELPRSAAHLAAHRAVHAGQSSGPRFADALTERYAGELLAADVVVVVHPVWFFHVPAVLKGWVDRVVREDVAFALDASGTVTGLLRARSALIVTTANTAPATERSVFGAPLDMFWRTVVFGPAGVGAVERLALSPVRGSSPATRADWLAEVADATTRHVRDAT